MRLASLALLMAAALVLTLLSAARHDSWANGPAVHRDQPRVPVSGSSALPGLWRANGAVAAAPFIPRLRVPAGEHRWPLLIGAPVPPVQIPSPENVHVQFAGDRPGR